MKITLPLPPPENERLIYAKHMGRFVLSKKYRDYKKLARWELLKLKLRENWELQKPTFEDQLQITIEVFLPNKKRDAHGILKPLMDVMEGFIYDNDRWVVPRFTLFQLDRHKPRVEVII